MKAQVTTVITKYREIFFVAKIKFYEFFRFEISEEFALKFHCQPLK